MGNDDAEREQDMLSAILHRPNDPTPRQVLCDWLNRRGDPRAELMTLQRQLLRPADPSQVSRRLEEEQRLGELLLVGIEPLVPKVSNSLGMELVLIPAGEFMMGSSRFEVGNRCDERKHKETIERPFLLGVIPVTQEVYTRVTTRCDSQSAGTDGGLELLPVDDVDWYKAVDFCNRLSMLEGLPPYYSPAEIRGRQLTQCHPGAHGTFFGAVPGTVSPQICALLPACTLEKTGADFKEKRDFVLSETRRDDDRRHGHRVA
jgi:uncharacterized protein (TIGR02996 family)